MAYQLEPLGLSDMGPSKIEEGLARLFDVERPRYRRLWNYFANPLIPRAFDNHENPLGKPYIQGQEWGLPMRITGAQRGSISPIKRKEVVIENDIAWRINTMVEYLFGRELGIESAASDPERQQLLTAVLRQVMALLSKNARKQTTYGAGIRRMCALILGWLNACGALPTEPAERAVKLYWPDPLPGDEMEALQEAQAKINVGVPKEVVLKELGY